MKQLSERALTFLNSKERKKEFHIEREDIEEHLTLYPIKDFSEILRFQKSYSGYIIQDIIFHIFKPEQIKKAEQMKTFLYEGQLLFPLCDGLYLSESGTIALKDDIPGPYLFFYESFETFVEQQAFFESHQEYRELPCIGYGLDDIHLLAQALSDYEVISECSDRYHMMWKNSSNLVHVRLYPEGYNVILDSISEDERTHLIQYLQSKQVIRL